MEAKECAGDDYTRDELWASTRVGISEMHWIFSLTLDSSKERARCVELIHDNWITESLYNYNPLGKRSSELKIYPALC